MSQAVASKSVVGRVGGRSLSDADKFRIRAAPCLAVLESCHVEGIKPLYARDKSTGKPAEEPFAYVLVVLGMGAKFELLGERHVLESCAPGERLTFYCAVGVSGFRVGLQLIAAESERTLRLS